MQNWITDFMEQYGYIGIALIIALENVFPPIPSEIILPFGGFMTTYTSLTLPGVIIAATIGSVLGAVILYGIGLLIDVERLEKIVDRWGHILRIKKKISTVLMHGLTNMECGRCYSAAWCHLFAVSSPFQQACPI